MTHCNRLYSVRNLGSSHETTQLIPHIVDPRHGLDWKTLHRYPLHRHIMRAHIARLTVLLSAIDKPWAHIWVFEVVRYKLGRHVARAMHRDVSLVGKEWLRWGIVVRRVLHTSKATRTVNVMAHLPQNHTVFRHGVARVKSMAWQHLIVQVERPIWLLVLIWLIHEILPTVVTNRMENSCPMLFLISRKTIVPQPNMVCVIVVVLKSIDPNGLMPDLALALGRCLELFSLAALQQIRIRLKAKLVLT
jgi:hypothetical protein